MIQPGQTLLHYRIVEKIGEGGMGEVWKAVDTTLDREVAIKFLPDAFAGDAERLARFEREAKMLATLNHANIASVYGLHESDGKRFIAMEMVPGEDLAQRLARGPLAVEDAVDVARQVAEALEAAHEQGVIHRDLKPANIKRTPDGKIKVLDLGLAKALAPETSSDPASVSLSPTMTSAGTVAGTLLGTAAYMSPEQAKGRAVDRRADIWAFGVVLHEMLTGSKMFEAETISETLAAVLRDDVSFDRLPRDIPASVTSLLKRCLDRDPRTRLRDIGEARIALAPESLAASGPAVDVPTSVATPPRGREWLAWAVAAVALLAVVALAWLALGRGSADPPEEIRASIRPPAEQRFEAYGTHSGGVTISPDGTRMTFVSGSGSGRPSLYVRTLGSDTAQPVPGSEGATYPFWSPDSRQIGFFLGGKLKKVDLGGGAPMTICDASEGRGGTWNRDGVILFAPDTQAPIHRVLAGGGVPEPVTNLDISRLGETTHRYPFFLPDGNHFLYLRGSHAAANDDDVNSIWIGSLDSDETTELMQSGSNARYARGHLFFVRDRFLMAQPFDTSALRFTGDAFVVGEEIVFQPTFWRGAFDASENGLIVFQGGLASDRFLTWFDRDGNELEVLAQPGSYETIRLSPDGRSLAATVLDENSGRADIWIHDVKRKVGSRLTFDEMNDTQPVWSPDGKRVAFQSNRAGPVGNIFVRQADGRGDAEVLFASEATATPQDWSPDGKHLAIDHGIGKSDLWIVPLDGGEPFSLVATEFDEGYARFSPDGEWLGYISNESGRYELYLTRFPGGEGKWQLSANGADWLLGWKRDGTELYYLDLEGGLTAVRVELGQNVVVDMPQRLFPTRAGNTWDSALDGERFILGVPDDPTEDYPITLVVNWNGSR